MPKRVFKLREEEVCRRYVVALKHAGEAKREHVAVPGRHERCGVRDRHQVSLLDRETVEQRPSRRLDKTLHLMESDKRHVLDALCLEPIFARLLIEALRINFGYSLSIAI